MGSGHLIAILAHFMQPSNWTVREPNQQPTSGQIYIFLFFVGKLAGEIAPPFFYGVVGPNGPSCGEMIQFDEKTANVHSWVEEKTI